MCEGNIYFTTNDVSGLPNPHFNEAINYDLTANFVNGTTSVKCDASSFDNTDPLPGVKKQCMCDNSKTTTSFEEVQLIKESWR